MLAIPEQVLSAFEAGLRDVHVPVPQQNAYKKWLRFYWDFCKKYGFTAGQRASLPAFLQKLRSKKPSEEACLQAQTAVELFYGLCEQRRGKVQRVDIAESGVFTSTSSGDHSVNAPDSAQQAQYVVLGQAQESVVAVQQVAESTTEY